MKLNRLGLSGLDGVQKRDQAASRADNAWYCRQSTANNRNEHSSA